MLTASLISKIDGVLALDSEECVVGSKWSKIEKMLLDEKIAVRMKLHTDDLMVHQDNRGGLGLNCFNAHRNGKILRRVGADLNQLSRACCFELARSGPRRKISIDFNKRLTADSEGLLCDVKTTERFLTVSCGHTAAFCRAANSRCKTSEDKLKSDKTGRLDPASMITTDPQLAIMLQEGWTWVVIPDYVEDQWPGLPALAQSALNGPNNVASKTTELEAACMIARHSENMEKKGLKTDWKACCAHASETEPDCTPYIDQLGEYVKMYGGGSCAPMVHFQDAFAKKYGPNRKLGREFVTAVVQLLFRSSTQLYPHTRNGLFTVNLISPKVEEGLCKFLDASHVERLRAKALEPEVDKVEESLAIAWNTVEKAKAAGLMHEDEAIGIYGRFSCRCLMYLTKTAKKGFEAKEYDNVEQIIDLFNNDMLFKSSKPVVSADSNEKAPTASSSKGPASFEEVSSGRWLREQEGFAIGKMYTCKKHHGRIFMLEKMAESCAVFKELNLNFGAPIEVTSKHADLKKEWFVFKGIATSKVVGDISAFMPSAAHVQVDLGRCAVYQALIALAVKHQDAHTDLIFTLNPSDVRADREFKKGELKLVPATDAISKLSTKKSQSSIAVTLEGATFYIEPPAKFKSTAISEWSKTTVVQGFWWVSSTADKDVANMVHTNISEDGINFKCLVNKKAVKKYEKLVFFKQPEEPDAKKQKVAA